jgi:HSP20 family protein
MANFLEKLKKSMGATTIQEKEKTIEEKPAKSEKVELKERESIKKIKIGKTENKKSKETPIKKLPELKEKEIVEKEEITDKWLETEGELVVDVYQTETDLVVVSVIAGVNGEDLNIWVEGDVLSIEGERKKPLEEKGDYFFQECYWGKFGRKIILPVEIDPNKIEASFEKGILIIRMPKLQREKKRKIVIKE